MSAGGAAGLTATKQARALLASTVLLLAVGCRGPSAARDAAPTELEQESTSSVYGPPPPPAEELSLPPRPEGWQGPEPEPEELGLIDGVRRGVTMQARSTAAWVDSFLSDERSLAEDNRTWVRLRLDAFSEEREGVDFDVRARARLVLPRSEDRFQLVFSGDGQEELEDEDLLDEDALPLLDEEEESNATLGLQYLLRQTRRNNVRTEVGLRFDGISPVPYVGARYRYQQDLLSWTLRATERLRWYSDVGWESKTTLDLERPLSARLFLRSSGRVNWYEDEEGLFYSTALRLYQALGPSQLLTYEWSNSFETEPEDRLKQVRARVRWSQRFLRDWILLELAPQVAWREDDDYEPALGMLVRLELGFGTEPRRSAPTQE